MRSLTTNEVARYFRITTAALRARAKNNPDHPQPIRINARIWLWDADALEKFYKINF